MVSCGKLFPLQFGIGDTVLSFLLLSARWAAAGVFLVTAVALRLHAEEEGPYFPVGEAAADDAPVLPEGSAASQLVSVENDVFAVVALNWADARAVERISDALSKVVGPGLSLPSWWQQLIVVQLVPPEFYSGEDAYHIEIDERGGTVVSLRWDETLSLESTCEALARSYLIQRLRLVDPSLDPGDIPDWMIFAVGAALESSWLPGRRDAFREQAKWQPPLGFADILTAKGPYGEIRGWIATESYWLFQFLTREWRDLPDALWLTMLTGNEPDWQTLANHSATPGDPLLRELWWAVGRSDLLLSRTSAVLPPDEARELIIRLAHLTHEDEQGDARLSADAILELDDPSVFIPEALDRARIAKLLLVRINPLYHNALVSLGFYYETVGKGDLAAAARHFHQFLSDFHDASILHDAANRLIRE